MRKNCSILALAVPALLVAQSGLGAAFTPGSVVVVRVGTGATSLSTPGAAVFLDEYAANGSLVQSVPLPTAANGANAPFVLQGSGSTEGALSRSSDGQYLTLVGYAAVPGTTPVVGANPATVNRVVARIDAAGTVNTTTRLSAAFENAAARSATTDDGTRFWVAGLGAGDTGGIHYVELGSTGASVRVAAEPADARTLEIYDGQLYHAGTSQPYLNVATVGTGLPTTEGQTLTVLPGMPTEGVPGGFLAAPHAFVFQDRSAAIPGWDVLYLANGRALPEEGGGLQRWNFDGTTWTLAYTINAGLNRGIRGLVAAPGNPNVFYATTVESTNNWLVRVEDTGPASVFSVVTTAGTNRVFRGIDAAPVEAAPPCPADFDASGAVDVTDIFAFLSAWFSNAPGSDFDSSGGVDVSDIFAFLSAWFAGCD